MLKIGVKNKRHSFALYSLFQCVQSGPVSVTDPHPPASLPTTYRVQVISTIVPVLSHEHNKSGTVSFGYPDITRTIRRSAFSTPPITTSVPGIRDMKMSRIPGAAPIQQINYRTILHPNPDPKLEC
jgi:hypothetical protein